MLTFQKFHSLFSGGWLGFVTSQVTQLPPLSLGAPYKVPKHFLPPFCNKDSATRLTSGLLFLSSGTSLPHFCILLCEHSLTDGSMSNQAQGNLSKYSLYQWPAKHLNCSVRILCLYWSRTLFLSHFRMPNWKYTFWSRKHQAPSPLQPLLKWNASPGGGRHWGE